MANSYWNKGPVSDDVAKGQKFSHTKIGDSNPNLKMTNSPSNARSTIMGLKVNSLPGFSTGVESGLKGQKAKKG